MSIRHWQITRKTVLTVNHVNLGHKQRYFTIPYRAKPVCLVQGKCLYTWIVSRRVVDNWRSDERTSTRHSSVIELRPRHERRGETKLSIRSVSTKSSVQSGDGLPVNRCPGCQQNVSVRRPGGPWLSREGHDVCSWRCCWYSFRPLKR